VTGGTYGDVSVAVDADFVATVELRRPPANFFDVALIRSLAEAYEGLDADDRCRALILCAEGKHFCAGADFTGASSAGPTKPGDLYTEAVRLFSASKPVVAAVQGAAIGGGLGLACSADFRVAGPSSRFAANFARLGFHHGFGLTVTLPAIIGQQRALELLYTGVRIDGRQAATIGLVDHLVPDDADIRDEAHALASEIAESAPLAVASIRQTMRGDLAERVRAATAHEQLEQARLQKTSDFAEGIRASAERRDPNFEGR
jgi:enoyl-CoA hydratase/carnithine racemase